LDKVYITSFKWGKALESSHSDDIGGCCFTYLSDIRDWGISAALIMIYNNKAKMLYNRRHRF